MRFWDESIFAVNTFEMLENRHYFSLYYNGEPDLFNTKPPLTNWFQLFFVKLFGFNEFAVRLPSAIAAGLSIVFLFRFVSKNFGYLFAWVTALILLTSNGFIGFHTARTADSDALLTFFMLMTTLSFFKYIIHTKERHILYGFIFLSLAFATKLYASFLFLPAYIGILFYQKKLKSFLFNWHFFLGFAFLTFSALALVYLRELETPGYLAKILFKDAGRLFSVVENHSASTHFFLDNFYEKRFSFWMVFFAIGSISLCFEKDIKSITILQYSFWCILSYFLIITFSVTKLEWYDMPLYPLIALIAALPLTNLIRRYSIEKKIKPQFIKGLLLIALFIYPLFLMFRQSQDNTIHYGDKLVEANEIYLFNRIKKGKNLNTIKVYYHGWNGSLLFYKYKLSCLNQNISLERNIDSLAIGDNVLVCNDSLTHALENRFQLEKIDNHGASNLYLLK